MARKNANTNATANENKGYAAIAEFFGVVVDYYDKGKKYDYVTIDVPHAYDEYYDRFKIAVNKSWECPDNGESVMIKCNIHSYKGDVSFKEINADVSNK